MPKNRKIPGSFFFAYVNEYLENMRIELKSGKTVETYRTGLNEFRKYLLSEHGKAVDKATVGFVTADLVKVYPDIPVFDRRKAWGAAERKNLRHNPVWRISVCIPAWKREQDKDCARPGKRICR